MAAHRDFRSVAGPMPIIRDPTPWLRVSMVRKSFNWEVHCYRMPSGTWIGKGPADGRMSPDAVAAAVLRGLSRVLRQRKHHSHAARLQNMLSEAIKRERTGPERPPCPGVAQDEPKEPLLQPHERHEVARWIRWARRVGTVVLLLQSLAFVSFMWEESLQTAGFACKAAMDAKHEPTTAAAISQYSTIMDKAQAWQSNAGWLALWAHGAYRAYFYLAAPMQLEGFRARQASIWPAPLIKEDVGWPRITVKGMNEATGKKIDPMHPQAWEARGAAAIAGFDPWLRWPMGSIPGDEGEIEETRSAAKPTASQPTSKPAG